MQSFMAPNMAKMYANFMPFTHGQHIEQHIDPAMDYVNMLAPHFAPTADLCDYTFDIQWFFLAVNLVGLVVMALGCHDRSAVEIIGGGMTAEVACWGLIVNILYCQGEYNWSW